MCSSDLGQEVMLVSAAVGAIAGPTIFEFPFDLIVMGRIYPALPPDPALYRALFFAPLFLVEFTTLSLLAFSPLVRVSRWTFFSFASILIVFAVWAWSGFAYPSAPLPITLNMVSKVLAFVTALSLFFPRRTAAVSSRLLALSTVQSPLASNESWGVLPGREQGDGMKIGRSVIATAGALAACGVLGIASAAAQASSVSAPTWTKQTPAAHPSPRVVASMAYDAATGDTVLFGGASRTPSFTYLSDTWTWG